MCLLPLLVLLSQNCVIIAEAVPSLFLLQLHHCPTMVPACIATFSYPISCPKTPSRIPVLQTAAVAAAALRCCSMLFVSHCLPLLAYCNVFFNRPHNPTPAEATLLIQPCSHCKPQLLCNTLLFLLVLLLCGSMLVLLRRWYCCTALLLMHYCLLC